MTNYYTKYLKYKEKYISLKKILGAGGNKTDEEKTLQNAKTKQSMLTENITKLKLNEDNCKSRFMKSSCKSAINLYNACIDNEISYVNNIANTDTVTSSILKLKTHDKIASMDELKRNIDTLRYQRNLFDFVEQETRLSQLYKNIGEEILKL